MRVFNGRSSAIFCICIFVVVFTFNCIGCDQSNKQITEDYRVPGYINIQTFPMTADDVVEVRDILLDSGYLPIVSADFFYQVRAHDQQERYLRGLCVSEEYPSLYWHNLQASIEGRNITSQDVDNHERVCVIEKYTGFDIFGQGDSVIGKHIKIADGEFEIVGVLEGADVFDTLFIPFTAGADVGVGNDYLVLIWIDDGRDLSKEAYKIHQILTDEGFKVSVKFLNEDKEDLGLFPAES